MKYHTLAITTSAMILSANVAFGQASVQSPNQVYATPSSGSGYLSIRALVAADLAAVFAIPPAIGGTTPAAGQFTTLGATGAASFATIGTTGLASLQSLGVNAAGMVGDGTTNNNTAFTAIVTSLQTGGFTQLPCGKFKVTGTFTGTVTSGVSATLKGSGNCTTLFFSGTGAGLVFTGWQDTNSLTLSDMQITTDDATGVNTGLTITQTTVQNYQPASYITNVAFRGDDGYDNSDYWGIGVLITGASNFNFYGDVFNGNSTFHGIGLQITGTATAIPVEFNIANTSFNVLNKGIVYGTYTEGVQISNTNFTGNNYGIYVPASGTGLDELEIGNSQFNNFISNIYVGTNLPNLILHDSTIIMQPNAHGVDFPVTAAQVAIHHNIIGGSATATIGINFAGSGGGIVSIDSNKFDVLTTSINFGAAQVATIKNNTFDSVTGYFGVLQTSVVAYGNVPEAIYNIATLPTCATATAGIRLVIQNGIATPTYHQAVSTTGTTWWPVWCQFSSTTWVYD